MADTRDMYMAHDMFRREIGLLPALVRAATAGDTERAGILAAHLELVQEILHHHHHAEDKHIWPRLLDRGTAEVDPIVRVMEQQHEQIDKVVAEVTAGIATWRDAADPRQGAALADALDRLHGLLIEHLAVEEDQAVPLINKYITAAEWTAMIAEGGAEVSPEQTPLVFGMMSYEADPDVVRDIVAQLPLEVGPALTSMATEAFAAHSRLVHGTSTPARIGGR
jgi:hemerythrin-like domain-containing protein